MAPGHGMLVKGRARPGVGEKARAKRRWEKGSMEDLPGIQRPQRLVEALRKAPILAERWGGRSPGNSGGGHVHQWAELGIWAMAGPAPLPQSSPRHPGRPQVPMDRSESVSHRHSATTPSWRMSYALPGLLDLAGSQATVAQVTAEPDILSHIGSSSDCTSLLAHGWSLA